MSAVVRVTYVGTPESVDIIAVADIDQLSPISGEKPDEEEHCRKKQTDQRYLHPHGGCVKSHLYNYAETRFE